MDEVLKFLTENPTFFLATQDGDQARVRPFGFIMKFDEKLCFCTGSFKNVYKQMKQNPKVEMSGCSPEGRWLRLSGEVSFVTSDAARAEAFSVMPSLKDIYTDVSQFEIFTLKNAVATFCSFSGENRTFEL